MSVDNVGLKTCLLGTSNLMITLTIVSLVSTEVVPGRIQQPIPNFYKPLEQLNGPWCKRPRRGLLLLWPLCSDKAGESYKDGGNGLMWQWQRLNYKAKQGRAAHALALAGGNGTFPAAHILSLQCSRPPDTHTHNHTYNTYSALLLTYVLPDSSHQCWNWDEQPISVGITWS